MGGGGGLRVILRSPNVTKLQHASKACVCAGGLGPAQGPQKFWGFYAQICILHILETLFLSFLIPSSTPKKLTKIEHYIVFQSI